MARGVLNRVLSICLLPVDFFVARFRLYLQLTKTVLCLPVAGSATFGYVLYWPVIDWRMILVTVGVFFLACGAATGNSLQEIATDRLYARTCRRPLVTGRLTVRQAQLVCTVCIAVGLLLLWGACAVIWPLLLGLLALVTYNGLYTPLKQQSPNALLLGGIAGALPPLIGWTAAGGALFSTPSWLLFFLFFLWQVPHFFLVFLQHRSDYEAVGPPALMRRISEAGVYRVLLIWLMALVTAVLACPLFLPQLKRAGGGMFLLLAGALLAIGLLILWKGERGRLRGIFLWFNASFFLTLILVMAIQLWR